MMWTDSFKIVSYYTPNYQEYAGGLIKSIEEHLPHVPYEIGPVEPVEWKTATCFKGHFMRKKLLRCEPGIKGVLWIDIDALVKKPFKMPDVDFSIFARFSDHLRHSWSPFRTGTVFLANNEHGKELAKWWEVECGEQKDGIDQWALWRAWLHVMEERTLPSTYFLPQDYCRKVDEPGQVKIQHLMASRTKK